MFISIRSGVFLAKDKVNRLFRPDVQGLRALAVISVILFHYDVTFLSGGYLGVDIFFVISGYVISLSIYNNLLKSDGEFSYMDFYARRARRILPAFLATIVLVLLTGSIFLSAYAYKNLDLSALFATFSLSNFYFMSTTGYFDVSAVEKPLLHMWSLSVEEQFYLVWPFVWVWIYKRQTVKARARWLIGLSILFIIISEVWVQIDRTAAYFMMPSRFFEFLLGASIVAFEKDFKLESKALNTSLFLLGLAGISYALITYEEKMDFPGLLAVLPALSIAIMIYSGKETPLNVLFSNKIARSLGAISYSLYLIHWPLVVFYKYVLGYSLSTQATITLLIVSILSGYLMWYFIEQPFRKREGQGFKIDAKRFYRLLVYMISGIVLFTIYAYMSEGMAWRLGAKDASAYRQYIADEEKTKSAMDASGSPFQHAIGDSGQNRTRVALIGDSHSAHFRVALSDFLEDNGIRGVQEGNNGCLPILNASVNHGQLLNAYARCRYKTRKTFNKVLDEEEIEVVILAGRWSLYTRNTRLGENGSRGKVYLGTSPDDERSSKRSKTIFKYRIESTVKSLLEKGKKVILIGQAPNIGFDVRRCLFSPGFHGLDYAGCTPSTTEAIKQNLEFTNDVLAHVAKRYDDVLFIDSEVAFCDGECTFRQDNRVLYLDSNHLVYPGAMMVLEKNRDRILSLLDQ